MVGNEGYGEDCMNREMLERIAMTRKCSVCGHLLKYHCAIRALPREFLDYCPPHSQLAPDVWCRAGRCSCLSFELR